MNSDPMPIKKVLDALFEGPCDLPTLHERTGIAGNDLQRMLATLAEMKNATCEKQGGRVIWRLTDDMEESMQARVREDDVNGEVVDSHRSQTRRGFVGKRKAGELVVSKFVPARPEVSIYRQDDDVVIKVNPGSERVSVPVSAITSLIEGLKQLVA
jgi:hypothetical protein